MPNLIPFQQSVSLHQYFETKMKPTNLNEIPMKEKRITHQLNTLTENWSPPKHQQKYKLQTF